MSRTVLAVVAIAFSLLTLTLGCDSRSVSETNGERVAHNVDVSSALTVGTADAGPSCNGGGDPTTGVDGGTCTGFLGQSMFKNAVCSCDTIDISGTLTVDAFDSTRGAPAGGAGGSVASNGCESWSGKALISGNLVSKGPIRSSGPSEIAGDLRLGDTFDPSAPITIDGNAYVVGALPRKVTVRGTTSHVASVAAPCDCTNVIPVATIVAAHRASNDNAAIGLSANAANGTSIGTIDLPCGNYYLSQVTSSGPLTITAHGHTALYVDGDVRSSGHLTFALAPGATFDIFIAGSVNTSGQQALGSITSPASCRMYVAGNVFAMSGGSTVGCNVYAPKAAFAPSGGSAIYGALFVGSLATSGNSTIHYDTAVQSAGGECCTAAKCDDGNACTVDTCNGDGTCNHAPASDGTRCAGSNKCEQTYACKSGACVGSQPIVCTASDQCHVAGTCDPVSGQCSNPAAADGASCNDGNACTKTDACNAGTCAGSNPVSCTSLDQCHVAGTCNPASGACSNPASADGTSCNDSNACTQTDACHGGSCVGTNPVVCAAADQCHVAGTCDSTSGACSIAPAPNGVACNDGNACTTTDRCTNGACGGTAYTCAPSDCQASATCDGAGGCATTNKSDGSVCTSDNLSCTNDVCAAGTCAHPIAANSCIIGGACYAAGAVNSGNACQSCQPATSATAWSNVGNGTACTDGNACTKRDVCTAGTCGGTAYTCAASDCQASATCDGTGGCATTNKSDGSACTSDNVACTNDVCTAGTCAHPLAANSCFIAGACYAANAPNAANACQSCQPGVSTSAWSNNDSASCADDGLACTADVCRAGACTHPTQSGSCVIAGACYASGAVNSSNSCQSCAPASTASAWTPSADGASCADDGLACTSDTCRSGACAHPLQANSCVIGGACYAAGAVNAANACQTCAPAQSTTAWSAQGNSCAIGGSCYAAGAANPANACQSCRPAVSTSAWSGVTNGTACDDGNACTTSDVCTAGACGGAAYSCTPGECQASSTCDGAGGCTTTAKAGGTSCTSDNIACTNDVCTGGACTHPLQANSCFIAGACYAAGAANAANPCQSCNPSVTASAWSSSADGTTCSDGNACTQVDSCQSGACVGSSLVQCAASDQCHVAGACDPASGVCSKPAVADGTACNDGSACTQTDACQTGMCVGSNPVQCAAADQCHLAGACDPSSGACSKLTAPDGTGCNDGNACTATDSCHQGACVGASPVSCPAADACHSAGTCNPSTGVCANPALGAGTACADNSNKCIGASTCNASATCIQAPTPIVDDGDACTQDSCDPATGVTHIQIPGCGPTTDLWKFVVGRPGPRDGAAAAFDPTSNALLLFGGENAGASLGDTWTLDRASGRWSAAYGGGPDARSAAAAAFDSVRKRFVVFGGITRGATGDTFLGDTWEYDPASKSWAQRASASPPPARAYATALFDAARKRVVVFGGRGASGASDNGDLWEWDGAAWARRAATGTPLARSAAASVYDSARNRYVLFGGESVLGPSLGIALDDTWELDPSTATWASVTPSQRPPARLGHAMYFDAARAKSVAFGGTSPAFLQLGDTWEYDGVAQTWNNRAPSSSPQARAGHALVYDPTTTHALLVGGVAYSSTGQHTPNLDDTWELDGRSGAWTPRTADSAPARYRRGVVYDPARRTLVLRGAEARPAMWELMAGRWVAKEMLAGMTEDFGAPFETGTEYGDDRRELARAALVFDSTRGRTLYLAAGPQLVSGTGAPWIWEWDGARWSSRACSGSAVGLSNASLAFDGARSRIVVAGGTASGGTGLAPLWEIDPVTCAWTQRTSSVAPPARLDALTAWDSKRNVVVMFGGSGPGTDWNQVGFLQDTWEWDGAAGTWTQRSIGTAPTKRMQSAMAYDPRRQRIVLFGGFDGTFLGDTWEYDGATWKSMSSSGPSARADASLAFDSERGNIVLFGGTGPSPSVPRPGGVPFTDLWDWDGTAWKQRVLGAAPFARSGASGGWIPELGLAVMFGGVRGDGERAYLQDTWIWRNGEWTSPSTTRTDDAAQMPWPLGQRFGERDETPAPRAGHAFAVGEGDSMGNGLLFGGEGDTGLLGDTWEWDSTRYAWVSATFKSAIKPAARSGHAMSVLPGRGYLLYGGTGASKSPLGDTYVWTQSDGWRNQVQALSGTPSPRSMIAMATDLVRRKVVLFGGRGVSGALQDTWEFDIDGAGGWSQRVPPFSPPARFGHAMYYDTARDTVVMVGGTGDEPESTLGDVWEWNGATGTWSMIPSAASFGPRAGAVAFFDSARGQGVIFGGLAYRQSGAAVATFGDTWAFARANERHRSGIACTGTADCASGFCVDGYCCGSACGSQCGACNVAGSLGTCTAVSGAPRGTRAACSGSGSGACSSQCDGADVALCHPAAAGTVCAAATCASSASAIPASTCDSSGNCQPAGAPTSCNPYVCGGSACLTSCTVDGQCAAGGFCNTVDQTCGIYARLATLTTSPTIGKVGSPLTLSATLSAGTSVQYLFLQGPSDGVLATACRGYASTCSFTPKTAGTYSVIASVLADGSPNTRSRGEDDERTITVEVTP